MNAFEYTVKQPKNHFAATIFSDITESGWPCDDADYFDQPRKLWNDVLSQGARQRMVDAIVASMAGSPKRIQLAVMPQFYAVHDDFGDGVAKGLGIDRAEVPTLEQVLDGGGVDPQGPPPKVDQPERATGLGPRSHVHAGLPRTPAPPEAQTIEDGGD